MNMVNSSLSSTYSLNYYDKSYQSYYTTPPDIDASAPEGELKEPRDGGLDEEAPKHS